MQISKYKKSFTFIYIVVLIVGYFVVKGTLNDTSIDVGQKQSEEQMDEIKPARVTLLVPSLSRQYKVEMKNTDSVLDLLENLRKDGSTGFFYEKTLYTYGIELCCINNSSSNWVLIHDGENITHDIDSKKLVNNGVYTLERATIRIGEPQ